MTLVSRRAQRGQAIRSVFLVNNYIVARARATAQRRRARVGADTPHCIRIHAQSAVLQDRNVTVAAARCYSTDCAARAIRSSTIASGRVQKRSGVIARNRAPLAPRRRDPAGVRKK